MSTTYPKDVERLRVALPQLLAGVEEEDVEALYHWWSEEMNHASWLNISDGVPEEFGAWLSGSPSPALVRDLHADNMRLRGLIAEALKQKFMTNPCPWCRQPLDTIDDEHAADCPACLPNGVVR